MQDRSLPGRAAVVGLFLTAPVLGAQGSGGRGAQMEDLLEELATRAAVYERTALRFSCREEARVTKYNSSEAVKDVDVNYPDVTVLDGGPIRQASPKRFQRRRVTSACPSPLRFRPSVGTSVKLVVRFFCRETRLTNCRMH